MSETVESQQTASLQFISRKDLRMTRQRLGDRWQWVVEDRIRDRFFRFSATEIGLLKTLRTPQTVRSLSKALHSSMRLKLSEAELKTFLFRLVNDNLISIVKIGEGNRYWKQYRNLSIAKSKQTLLGLLAIKLPGINPEWFLRSLNWLGALFFHPAAIIAVFALLLATAAYTMLAFTSVWEKIPSSDVLFSPAHVTGFFVAFCVVKFFHELGHGLACNRYGGNCREMGILFLVFMPCLYCDVSDIWNQPVKWKRIMVSAAGIYVELAIAVLCFWGWYLSTPGLANGIMFSVFMLGSFNTLFVNGNPLLKYDGYFVLSDLTNSPNLAQDSKNQLQKIIQQWLFQIPPQFKSHSVNWHVFYALSAILYRFLIVATILTMIYTFFDYLELTSFGTLFVGLISFTILIPMIRSLNSTIQSAYPRRLANWTILFSVIAILLFAFFNVGFKKRVFSSADIQVADPEYVYSSDVGKIVRLVSLGEEVSTGQAIVKIENAEHQLKQIELKGLIAETVQRLKGLRIKSSLGMKSEGELEYLEKHVRNLRNELSQLEAKIEALTIRAGRNGRIIASTAEPNAELLSGQKVSVFSPVATAASVEKGEVICLIGDQNKLCGYTRINQSQIDYLQIGQTVSVFTHHSKEPCTGKISQIALVGELEQNPQFSASDSNSKNRTFLVTFTIDARPSAIQHGFKTKIVIIGERMTLAQHCVDFLQRTFRF